MDIPRPSQTGARLRRRLLMLSGAASIAAIATLAIFRIKPAVPSVERSSIWIDTVKRGPMVRQVRGIGTLLPIDIRWLTARTRGRVEQIVIFPGAAVEPTSVILKLDNPDVTQAVADADLQLQSALAAAATAQVQVQRDILKAESEAATAKANMEQTQLKAQLYDQLFTRGLVSLLEMRVAKTTAEQNTTLSAIAEKRLAFAKQSVAPQLAAKEADVTKFRAQLKLKQAEADALNVRAGMKGILQVVPVEVGAQVEAGEKLARVADPSHLKAQIEIAESQAKDVQIGQKSVIDTRNGTVDGQVSRVAPSVQNGTVTVEVTFTAALPHGARPDLSVDGEVELERLDDVVFVGRPAFGQENAAVGMFRLDPTGNFAERTKVQLGRSSVTTIEIAHGLAPGDRVVLSDLSQWDSQDRIKLN